ncbi:MAG: YgeY family selenium metabolism-linked hydrolase [Anaerolineales bacterium]|nr:YgeY family selenium metabolism-linked hydrolase [Anaerolineales bacterium]
MDLDRIVNCTRSLVQQPSLSGQESAVVETVLAEMRALGFDRTWVDDNGSAIGVIEGAEPGPTLLLDAHCDTVGIAPGVAWSRDPFAAERDDVNIHGRGTADMKGALAAMVHAAASVDRERLTGRVVVSATVMEEVMEGQGLKPVMQAVQPDFVVIGEATDLNLNRGGRGRAEIHVETVGEPVHSSSPHLGRNAVYAMMNVIETVRALDLPDDPLLGPALFALTDIISDPYPGHSVIPSRCRVTFDRRLLPGETPDSVLGQILEAPELKGIELKAEIAAGEYRAYTGNTMRGSKFFPAWVFDESHFFVQTALRGLRNVGGDPQVAAYRFCTNAAYSAGVAGVPTVGFGPATEGDAHVVDEKLAVLTLAAAARGYQGIVDAALGKCP